MARSAPSAAGHTQGGNVPRGLGGSVIIQDSVAGGGGFFLGWTIDLTYGDPRRVTDAAGACPRSTAWSPAGAPPRSAPPPGWRQRPAVGRRYVNSNQDVTGVDFGGRRIDPLAVLGRPTCCTTTASSTDATRGPTPPTTTPSPPTRNGSAPGAGRRIPPLHQLREGDQRHHGGRGRVAGAGPARPAEDFAFKVPDRKLGVGGRPGARPRSPSGRLTRPDVTASRSPGRTTPSATPGVQVSVLATENTGVVVPDVFSFGDVVGATGSPAPSTTGRDLIAVRN